MFSLEKYIMQRVYVIYVSSFSLDYSAIQYLVQTIQIQRKRERQRRWDREKERELRWDTLVGWPLALL